MASLLVSRMKSLIAATVGRIHTSRTQRRMELVETLNLGGKRQLMLVVCEGKRYLIGAGGDSVHSIAEVKPTEDSGTTARPFETACEDGATKTHARRLH
jgi:flagellar biogenesis protein FliO